MTEATMMRNDNTGASDKLHINDGYESMRGNLLSDNAAVEKMRSIGSNGAAQESLPQFELVAQKDSLTAEGVAEQEGEANRFSNGAQIIRDHQEMDKDGDGLVNRSELIAYYNERRRAGDMTAEEKASLNAMIGAYDKLSAENGGDGITADDVDNHARAVRPKYIQGPI